MADKQRLTSPPDTEAMPKGVPFIMMNELAERYSFYGMRVLLFVFMTEYLRNTTGDLDVMSNEDARGYFHLFASAVYFTPIFGALLADIFIGKYRTIIGLSLVYCLGHFTLFLDDTRWGLAIGLSLIAVGAGGIKPCVSATLGDQFGKGNEHLLPRMYNWFYFAINLGAFVSMVLGPKLREAYGSNVAFLVPGILMLFATIVFWMGRNKYVHIPPQGTGFLKEAFSGKGTRSLLKLFVVFGFVSVFWALYDQTGAEWVEQAKHMDRSWPGYAMYPSFVQNWLGPEILPDQVQSLAPLLILILIPIFNFAVYPILGKFFNLTALRRICIGLFLTAITFLIPAWLQSQIDAGATPSIDWQILAYVLLMCAEVFVSVTCLEYSYTQAPKKMKSFIMSLYLLSLSMGNLFTAGVNFFIQNDDGTVKLEGASYHLFFVGLMFAAAFLFIFVAENFKEDHYIQGDEEEPVVERA